MEYYIYHQNDKILKKYICDLCDRQKNTYNGFWRQEQITYPNYLCNNCINFNFNKPISKNNYNDLNHIIVFYKCKYHNFCNNCKIVCLIDINNEIQISIAPYHKYCKIQNCNNNTFNINSHYIINNENLNDAAYIIFKKNIKKRKFLYEQTEDYIA
jgi:hypothetical protein